MRIRWRNLELPNRVVCDTQEGNYGRFVVEPFERGFGTTVGNSLRRILLSSLEGSAISEVRIDGVDHEFMALPGLYEDVTDVILNIKHLLIELEGDEPATLTVEKTGRGKITGADIVCDHRTAIVNKDHVIGTIVDPDTSFKAEMRVIRGRGYVTAEDNVEGEREPGVIYVDSIFSPIQRVRYKVESTRVGKMTNYDKLILEIWTDGTIPPDMALVEAAKIMRKHLNPFVQMFRRGPEVQQELKNDVETSAKDQQHADLRDKLMRPIDDLDLTVRAKNCMDNEGIQTIGELARLTESEILKIRHFGKTSLKEIKKKLTDMGLNLGMNVDEILKIGAE